MDNDLKHLNYLKIFHYVLGGFSLLFACFPLIHVGFGIAMVIGGFGHGHNTPPAFLGWIFLIIGGFFFLMGQTITVCLFLSGKYIKNRKHYWFTFILAAIICALFPFGTALGVFTIIVLSKDSVKKIYGIIPEEMQ